LFSDGLIVLIVRAVSLNAIVFENGFWFIYYQRIIINGYNV